MSPASIPTFLRALAGMIIWPRKSMVACIKKI
jgi:hypothetical protein